jgi:hypothetical protein
MRLKVPMFVPEYLWGSAGFEDLWGALPDRGGVTTDLRGQGRLESLQPSGHVHLSLLGAGSSKSSGSWAAYFGFDCVAFDQAGQGAGQRDLIISAHSGIPYLVPDLTPLFSPLPQLPSPKIIYHGQDQD